MSIRFKHLQLNAEVPLVKEGYNGGRAVLLSNEFEKESRFQHDHLLIVPEL
jgi:hypothetical protein